MTDEATGTRVQVARQVAHWQIAVVGLRDVTNFAAESAWRGVERYLDVALRRHLEGASDQLSRRADVLAAELRAATTAGELEQVRVHVVQFRRRYLQVETALSFFGEAINSRTTPRLGALLRACDALAVHSMESVLPPLRRDVPPVLTYVDKGLGASILRAGLRLWDGGTLSPAAAIKITRQNLLRPTALIHESGHQVAHILGWNEELAGALGQGLAESPEVAEAWAAWSSEIAADCFAFVHTGYGSVAALHDVVSGGATVFRRVPADPHPVAYVRVLLGVPLHQRAQLAELALLRRRAVGRPRARLGGRVPPARGRAGDAGARGTVAPAAAADRRDLPAHPDAGVRRAAADGMGGSAPRAPGCAGPARA